VSACDHELCLDGRGAITGELEAEPPRQSLHRHVSAIDVRQQQVEAGAARILDDGGQEGCAEPAPLQVGWRQITVVSVLTNTSA
jgi:hypothetical protein